MDGILELNNLTNEKIEGITPPLQEELAKRAEIDSVSSITDYIANEPRAIYDDNKDKKIAEILKTILDLDEELEKEYATNKKIDVILNEYGDDSAPEQHKIIIEYANKINDKLNSILDELKNNFDHKKLEYYQTYLDNYNNLLTELGENDSYISVQSALDVLNSSDISSEIQYEILKSINNRNCDFLQNNHNHITTKEITNEFDKTDTPLEPISINGEGGVA